MFGKLQVSKEIREDRNVDESDKLAETLNNQSNRIEDFNDNQEVAGPSKVTSQSSTYFWRKPTELQYHNWFMCYFKKDSFCWSSSW